MTYFGYRVVQRGRRADVTYFGRRVVAEAVAHCRPGGMANAIVREVRGFRAERVRH